MRKPLQEIALPTHGGEYEQRADGSIEPTPLEQQRRAQAEQAAASEAQPTAAPELPGAGELTGED